MKNSLETRLGLFVALIVIAAFFLMFIVGGFESFHRGVHLQAHFKNALELKKGDRVKLAGVEVGRVEDITVTNNAVVVAMKLRAKSGVKTDSIATIKFAGLLGQNFVALDFGTPGALPVVDNTLLQSTEQPDLSAIMQKLDNVATGVENLTKSFSGDTIQNLVGPFTDFLKQNSAPLTATIANLRAMSGEIAEGKGTMGRLIYDDSLYTTALTTVSNLQATADEIKLTLADARKVIDGVNAGEGTLGKLVKDDRLYAETTEMMTNLKEISQKINQGQGTVGKLINDPEFYKNARLTLQKLDQATESLEDSGPLSVLGMAIGKLF